MIKAIADMKGSIAKAICSLDRRQNPAIGTLVRTTAEKEGNHYGCKDLQGSTEPGQLALF